MQRKQNSCEYWVWGGSRSRHAVPAAVARLTRGTLRPASCPVLLCHNSQSPLRRQRECVCMHLASLSSSLRSFGYNAAETNLHKPAALNRHPAKPSPLRRRKVDNDEDYIPKTHGAKIGIPFRFWIWFFWRRRCDLGLTKSQITPSSLQQFPQSKPKAKSPPPISRKDKP